MANLKLATAGVLTFEFNGTPVTVSGIDLNAAASFADVAATIETALNANADVHLATATVTYDAVNAAFNFNAGLNAGQNVTYQYMVGMPTVAEALTASAALIGFAGTAIT